MDFFKSFIQKKKNLKDRGGEVNFEGSISCVISFSFLYGRQTHQNVCCICKQRTSMMELYWVRLILQYLVLTVPSLVFNFDFVNGGRRTLEGLIHNCYQFNVWHGRPAYVESFSITSLHTKSIFINLRSNGTFIGPFRKCKKFCISTLYVVTVVATSYYTRAVYDISISVSKWLLYCYIYVLSVINT